MPRRNSYQVRKAVQAQHPGYKGRNESNGAGDDKERSGGGALLSHRAMMGSTARVDLPMFVAEV